MRKCRFCGQGIADTSTVCEHCGKELIPGRKAAEEMKRAALESAAETPVKTGTTIGVDAKTVDAQIKALGDFHQWFTRREIQYLPAVLSGGETIRALTSGFYEGNTWLVVVTDQRILFLDKGMVYGLKQVELPLRQISTISHKTGLLYGELHIATGSGKSIVQKIPKGEVAKISSIVSSLVRNAHAPSAQPSAQVAPVDVAAQLERLASLMERGVLTPQEFAAQKAKLLS